LHAIEDYIDSNGKWIKYAPNYVLHLYNDIDVLTDDVILEWYDSLDAKHKLRQDKEFVKLVQWLQQDDDESSEG
jgi:hypothetical protein